MTTEADSPRDVPRLQNAAAAGGILGAVAASSCCMLPLLLFTLGASGPWIGTLVRLAPYQPYFIAVLADVSLVEAPMHYVVLNAIGEQIRKSRARRRDDIWRRRDRVQLACTLAELMMERSMTKFTTSLVLGLLILSSGAAMAEQRTVTLAVDNMYCEACPYMVKKTIEKVSGVSKVTVSFKEKTAVVMFDDAKAAVKDLTDAATNGGFPSTPKG